MIFLPPLATILKEEEEYLEREGMPFTADFSTVKGAGLRDTEAIIEDAIDDGICLNLLLTLYFTMCVGGVDTRERAS